MCRREWSVLRKTSITVLGIICFFYERWALSVYHYIKAMRMDSAVYGIEKGPASWENV